MILSQLNQNFLDKNITKFCYPWCSTARASRARESSAINFYSHKNVYCCDISMLMETQRFCFYCYARLSDFPLSWRKVTEWNKPYPPTLYRGTFDIKGEIKDTFLHMKDWTKGVAFINGHNLGRYWELGPQETLYLPAPWLRRGNNEVSFTEQFRLSYSEIRCFALRRISGFFCSVNHLSGPLRKHMVTCTSSKGHRLRFVIGGFRSVLFVSCFKVRCFVMVLFRAIID